MKAIPSLEDLVGLEHCKLGFFQELRQTIEELKASNRQSEHRRQEIAAILDGITDLMMVLSEDLRIISVNHVFHELLGEENPEGRFCYEIFRNETVPCPECPAHRSFRTNTVCRETAIFKLGGRNRQFEMVASPIQNPDKPEKHILIFKRDVTMEKEYQAKFYQAEKMATVGVLAAGVAHEINNPLAAVSGFAEGIRRRLRKLGSDKDDPNLADIADYANTILKECRRCQDIVHTLLTFSRPVSAGFTPLSLNMVVNDTLKLLRHKLKKKDPSLRLHVELDPDLPSVHGDEPQLKQVLLNLLINASDAIDYEDRAGDIYIRTYRVSSEMAGLEVADTGCGIPAGNIDKLFEPFYTTKPVGKGIGIGLSTCYTIVKEHNGEIIVRSEQGKGSRFLVTLPTNADERA